MRPLVFTCQERMIPVITGIRGEENVARHVGKIFLDVDCPICNQLHRVQLHFGASWREPPFETA
jgi:hypothetical protein